MSDKTFSDKSADEEAFILTKTIFNIMCNFIPKEIVTIHDRDPLCINNIIKSLIKNKSNILTTVSNQIIQIQEDILNKCRMLFEKKIRFLSKRIISDNVISSS